MYSDRGQLYEDQGRADKTYQPAYSPAIVLSSPMPFNASSSSTEYSRADDNMFNSDNSFNTNVKKQSIFCACSGAPMSHVVDNAHSMTENFTKDDTLGLMICQTLPLKINSLLEFSWTKGGVSQDGGRVITGETFIHPPRAASQPEGEVGAFRHDSSIICRWSATLVLASQMSSSAKSQMHERLRTPSPTNSLQHESYSGAVRSTPRTALKSPAAVVGAPAEAPGVSSAPSRSPVAVQPSSHLHLLLPVCLIPLHLSPEHQTLGLYQMPSTHSQSFRIKGNEVLI
ncbi:hypothetical protein J6590_095525 [Homalodisca vitripennis]|nr:hypothetical protein J6590_095525 [Homalodisca vitripennis]